MNQQARNRQRILAVIFTVLFGLGLVAMTGGCANTQRSTGSLIRAVGGFVDAVGMDMEEAVDNQTK